MKKSFIILLLSTCLLLVKGQTKYSKEIENRIKQVEQSLSGWVQIEGQTNKWTLEERMKYYKVNGLSIAVIKDYKIEWVKGFGFADTANKIPVTPETIFQSASVGKSINSLGVLKLVQNKKIDLNADINLYLKSWKFPYDSLSKGKKITTAQLLSHTAGLTVGGFWGYKNNGVQPTIIEILEGKSSPRNSYATRSQFEPGTKYQYSGGGTTITQLMVTDITGESYSKYIEKNVLVPIGMTNSFYSEAIPANKKKLLATAYDKSTGKEVEGKYFIYPQAAGDLWTTPSDLAKYIIETQLSFIGKSNKVLSKEMSILRLTPQIDSVAMGVFIDRRGSEKYFHHGGGGEGAGCQYYGSLQGGNGVVVMMNQDYGPILEEIINSVATVYNWKDFYKPVSKKVITVNDTILKKYVGKYKVPNRIFTVTKKDNDYWYGTGGVEYKMYFTSDTEFFNIETKSEKKFFIDEKGKLIGIVRWWGNDVVGLERMD